MFVLCIVILIRLTAIDLAYLNLIVISRGKLIWNSTPHQWYTRSTLHRKREIYMQLTWYWIWNTENSSHCAQRRFLRTSSDGKWHIVDTIDINFMILHTDMVLNLKRREFFTLCTKEISQNQLWRSVIYRGIITVAFLWSLQ